MNFWLFTYKWVGVPNLLKRQPKIKAVHIMIDENIITMNDLGFKNTLDRHKYSPVL